MKKIIILIFAVVSGLVFFSCSKMMDLPSDGRLEVKDIFSKYSRINGYYSTCYGYVMQKGFTFDANNTPLASFSDEAHDANDHKSGWVSRWYSGNASSSEFPLVMSYEPWQNYFVGIRRCNSFLSYMADPTIATYPFVGAAIEERDGWLAQVRVLRAHYYMELVKRYGGVPIMDTPYEADHDYSKDKRASFEECIDFIIADCDAALSVPEAINPEFGLRWTRNSEGQRGHMTRAFAHAIRSEAALFAASPLWYKDGSKYTWAKALEITKEALDQCLAHGYELYKKPADPTVAQNTYAYYFITRWSPDQWNKESLFQTTAWRSNIWKHAGLPITDGQEKAGPGPSQELIDAYETLDGESVLNLQKPYNDADHLQPNYNTANTMYDKNDPYANRDPRFYASIYYNGAVRNLNDPNGLKIETFVGGNCGISEKVTESRFTRTGYYLRKFNNWKSGLQNDEDGMMDLYRLAELYLNFAEAAYLTVGPETKVPSVVVGQSAMSAKDAVDAIRERVGMPKLPSGLSTPAFEARYRNERRVELAFEENRFFDVRRWKILSETDDFVTGMKITKQGEKFTYTRIKLGERNTNTDRYLMFPIKQSEVSKMYGFTGQNWQNPNW